MSFAENIRLIRLTKGYSQEYMALMLNISQNAYCKIESGKTELKVNRVYEIAEILEIPIKDIMPEQ
jgi:transcriptional regulator with XRE-family HTH domain